MNLLPHWSLTEKYPAFYDMDSATAIEMVAKIYGKMQELITDYNNFVDSVNEHITAFENSASKNFETFTVSIRQEFQDFIDIIEIKYLAQDKKIDDAIAYMKTNLAKTVAAIMAEMKENGELTETILAGLTDLESRVDLLSTYATPQMFGAVADGITDDTEAIQKALETGKVFFPRGTYAVQFTDLTTEYSFLFALKSNMRLQFDTGAIIKVIGEEPAFRTALFSVNDADLPISNIAISGGSFIGIGDIGCFRLSTNLTGDKLISNIVIEDCDFSTFGSAVYIVQNKTEPTETRHTHNVTIKNCRAFECWGSFVTADGKYITIENCYADGNNNNAYDAVSVHCGINVTIKNNYFKNFNTGQCINVRNSSENSCGSKHIIITGNTIEDCPIKAISLTLSPEATYGLRDVVVSDNIIKNCQTGIFISCGSGAVGTPFNDFNICGNVINSTDGRGIMVTNNINVPLTNFIISDNDITADKYGFYIEAVKHGLISNNKIMCKTTDSLIVFQLGYIMYSNIVNNNVWCSNYSDTVAEISNCTGAMITNNYIRGKCNFSANSSGIIRDNNLMSVCINNGRVFTQNDEQHNSNYTLHGSGIPTNSEWTKGDKIINNFAVSNECMGWVCIEAGTVGTWVPFGAISQEASA